VADLRRIAVSAGVLLLLCAVGGVVFNRALVEHIAHPGANLAMNAFLGVIGLALLVAAKTVPADATTRLFPIAALALTLSSPPLIVIGLGTLGFGSFQSTGLLFLLALFYGFYLLVRPLALLLLAETAAAVVVLFAVSDGIVGPVVQAAVFVAVFGAVGFLLGRLVAEAHTSAERETAARAALAQLNDSLASQVAEQVGQLERLGQMRRFLPAQVADAIMTSGRESVLEPHRREIAVLFADLRGFTRFSGEVEPEEVLNVLGDYHRAFGREVSAFGATVGPFSGDGVMAYLNDPYPCDEPAIRIVELGLAFVAALRPLQRAWAREGYDLGCGVGIAMGHATLGVIGVEGRHDYTALGTAVNLAARLSDAAEAGQILIDRRVHNQIDDAFVTRQLPDRPLKGFAGAVPSFEVVSGGSPTA
jgi:class 3 adenylate cyclase